MDWNKVGAFIAGGLFDYLLFSGVAWLIIWAFELTYNPWAVGLVILVIYYLWQLIKPKGYYIRWRR